MDYNLFQALGPYVGVVVLVLLSTGWWHQRRRRRGHQIRHDQNSNRGHGDD